MLNPALSECERSEERAMNEIEALIQRREGLLERISRMNNEIEKIDRRMASLQRAEESGLVGIFHTQKQLLVGVL
jgi:predicted  nucleic acid-binding Zn-ribbon protein